MAIIGGRAHSIEEVIAVGNLGFPFVEISLDHPDQLERQIDQLNELKRRFNLTYIAHYPNEGDPNDLVNLADNFVPKVKKLIDLSVPLGIEKGTIHFWMDKRWAKPSLIKAKISLLSDLVDHASGRDVQLCLENLTSKYDSFSRFFKEIPNLRMTMDIGHGQLLSKENTSFGFMEHLFHKINHVHVHDNLGGISVKDDLHLPLGEGIVDYPRILTTLKNKGYHSTITLEVKPAEMLNTKRLVERYF